MAPQCLKRGFQQNTETLWVLYSHTNNVKKWAYAKSGIRDAGLKLGPTLGTQDPNHTWDLENPQPTKWNLRLCTLIVQETGDLRIFKQKGKHLHTFDFCILTSNQFFPYFFWLISFFQIHFFIKSRKIIFWAKCKTFTFLSFLVLNLLWCNKDLWFFSSLFSLGYH